MSNYAGHKEDGVSSLRSRGINRDGDRQRGRDPPDSRNGWACSRRTLAIAKTAGGVFAHAYARFRRL